MIPENETNIASPEIPFELLEKVAALPNVEPEIQDMNPVELIFQNTDENPEDYNEAVNNLVSKYTKK